MDGLKGLKNNNFKQFGNRTKCENQSQRDPVNLIHFEVPKQGCFRFEFRKKQSLLEIISKISQMAGSSLTE